MVPIVTANPKSIVEVVFVRIAVVIFEVFRNEVDALLVIVRVLMLFKAPPNETAPEDPALTVMF